MQTEPPHPIQKGKLHDCFRTVEQCDQCGFLNHGKCVLFKDPFTQEIIQPLQKKPQIVRMGGKRYLADRIVEKINALDYEMYVEPFFGGGRIFFQKEPHFVELINDIEGRIANFYNCCIKFPTEMHLAQAALIKHEQIFFDIYDRYHSPGFRDHIQKTLTSLWDQYNSGDLTIVSELIQHAMDFFFYSNMAFRGSQTARTMTYPENDPITEAKRIRWRVFRPIFWVSERMRRTTVMSQDFARVGDVALKYSHRRLWYFDPPYYETEGYESPFPLERYYDLQELLRRIPATDYFFLSLNDHPKMEEIFFEFNIERVATHYTTGGAGQSKAVEELVITPRWEPHVKISKPGFKSLASFLENTKGCETRVSRQKKLCEEQ